MTTYNYIVSLVSFLNRIFADSLLGLVQALKENTVRNKFKIQNKDWEMQ